MIVKMKKVSLVVLESEKERSLDKLRDLGVVHLEFSPEQNEKITELHSKKTLIERALSLLPDTEEEIEQDETGDLSLALEAAEKIDIENQKHFNITDKIHYLEREIDKLSVWGDFKPEDIIELREKGVKVKLYEVTKEQLEQFPESVKTFVISRSKVSLRVAAVFLEDVKIPFEEHQLPERSLSELEKELDEKKKELEIIDKDLVKLVSKRNILESGLEILDEMIEFESAVNSMSGEEKISYITGFVPVKLSDKLKEAASKNGWGIMLSDPSDDDQVPTLVENPKWIRAISPVFNLLGTIPGYKEFDISLWFLMFFSIFWGMIIGDAGYGAIFLFITIFLRIKFKKAPFEPFLLLFITSFSTIAWGGVTGNWFGVESLTKHELFSWMIIPSIASFKSVAEGNVDKLIMHICFVIGAVHLSVAHFINFFRLMPSLKAYSELGWLSVLWALYFLIRSLVLKYPPHPAALWMLGIGLGFVIIFSEQEGNFIKGVKNGFSNLILISLGSIGFFSDIVSYVRLFAVGLATIEVAKSFNTMAAGLGNGAVAIIGSVFILFFGHGLNIILGCMSLIVHGVRLNMLEFSGHLGMEWSGFAYKPFKKLLNKN